MWPTVACLSSNLRIRHGLPSFGANSPLYSRDAALSPVLSYSYLF